MGKVPLDLWGSQRDHQRMGVGSQKVSAKPGKKGVEPEREPQKPEGIQRPPLLNSRQKPGKLPPRNEILPRLHIEETPFGNRASRFFGLLPFTCQRKFRRNFRVTATN